MRKLHKDILIGLFITLLVLALAEIGARIILKFRYTTNLGNPKRSFNITSLGDLLK